MMVTAPLMAPIDGWPLPADGDLHLFGTVALVAVGVVFALLAFYALRAGRVRRAQWRCPLDGRKAITVYQLARHRMPPRVLRCSLLGPHRLQCRQECVRAA